MSHEDVAAMLSDLKRIEEETARKHSEAVAEKASIEKAAADQRRLQTAATNSLVDEVCRWFQACSRTLKTVKQTSTPGRRSYSIYGIDITVSADVPPRRVDLRLRWQVERDGKAWEHGTYTLCEIDDLGDDALARQMATARERFQTIIAELVARPEQASRIDYLAVALTR